MRKNNELNGVLVYRRWCAGAIISALFVLAIVGVPVLAAIYPWVKLTIPGGDSFSLTGLDLAKGTFQETVKFDTLVNAIVESGKSGYQYFDSVYGYGFYVIFGVFALICLFGLIEAIYALLYLFAGRVINPRSPVKMGWVIFAISLIYSGLGVGWSLMMQNAFHNAFAITLEIDYLWIILFPSIAFGLALLISIVYAAAFKNKWFIGQAKYFGAEKPNQPYQYAYNDGYRGANGQQVVIVNGGIPQQGNVIEAYPTVAANHVAKPSVSLPSGIRSIGGHAYSKNTHLRFADIPAGIKELGVGAFANCLNLEVVSIPKSVRKIHKNCFFNCSRLARINYAGTKQEWRYVARGANWLDRAGTKIVHCADGAIIVDSHR